MKTYLDLLRQCRDRGVRQKNRTGVDTLMVPGGMMQFDLSHGFPILTTKRVAFRSVVAELLGFIRGYTSAAQFRELGTGIWDANANKNEQWLKNSNRLGTDDLGRIYGWQWRHWQAYDHVVSALLEIDQLAGAIKKIKENPEDRRNIVTAWNPGELHRMALPPCHLLYQFLVGQLDRQLHMTMYMRSCDMFLGVPFNIASYGLLLSLVAQVTGYAPGTLTMFLADVHIYENHLAQVDEQLGRQTLELPELVVDSPNSIGATAAQAVEWLENLQTDRVSLKGYEPHPPIKAEMAV